MRVTWLSSSVLKWAQTTKAKIASCLGRDLALGLIWGSRAMSVGVADGLQFLWTHPFPSVALMLGVEAGQPRLYCM